MSEFVLQVYSCGLVIRFVERRSRRKFDDEEGTAEERNYVELGVKGARERVITRWGIG
jgi:hypothetical protein